MLTGLIAGFIFSWMVGRSGSGDGSGEIRLMEERLLKGDQGLAQQTSEQAALSRTQPVKCSRTFDPGDWVSQVSLNLTRGSGRGRWRAVGRQ